MGAFSIGQPKFMISLQKNQENQKNTFNFTQSRLYISQSILSFPSYIHYYHRSDHISYSLMQDNKNEICRFVEAGNQTKQFKIIKNKKNKSQKIWKRIITSQEYNLRQGSYIRLGRIQILVKQLKTLKKTRCNQEGLLPSRIKQTTLIHNKKQSNYSNYNCSKLNTSRLRKSNISTLTAQPTCRICFQSTQDILDPLLNVCNCSGSVKFIHYQCLKSWILSKSQIKQKGKSITYRIDLHNCQICNQTIPKNIIIKGRNYDLYLQDNIHPPYACLQYQIDGKSYRTLVVLQQNQILYTGRGSQNQIIINQGSVSRSHCSLLFNNNKLILRGHESKYGTYVELNGKIQINDESPLQILIKNNLIIVSYIDQMQKNNDCCSAQQNLIVFVE